MYAILVECDPGQTLGGSTFLDIINMLEMLKKRDFITNAIYILASSQQTLKKFQMIHLPTNCLMGNQIEHIMDELSKKNASFVYIHFSGHGYQKGDQNKDEIDGMDEYINLGNLLFDDDTFYTMMKKYLDKTCIIRVSVDCCHSGSFSDFKYQYNGVSWTSSSAREPYFNNAFSISACSDCQTDMCDIGNHGFGGALTVHLLDNPMAMDYFLYGNPKKTTEILEPILSKLGQKPILCKDCVAITDEKSI